MNKKTACLANGRKPLHGFKAMQAAAVGFPGMPERSGENQEKEILEEERGFAKGAGAEANL